MWQWLIVICVMVAVAWLAQPAGDVVVRVRCGQVRIRGKLTSRQRAELERFLIEQFPAVRQLRIDVSFPRAQRPLRIKIRGGVSRGERQLIRNFLTHSL